MIKLIALDLDGTLLNSEKRVTPYTRDVLRRAMARGVHVTLATGRMIGGAAYFGRQVGVNAPLICCNGGVVQGMDAPEPLFLRCLPQETVCRLLTLCHARGWYANWYIGREIFVEHFDAAYFHAYRTAEDFKVRVAVVERELPGEIAAQQNTGTSADLTPPGVTKALGLSFLMEQYGLTPAEVMACGDADNDLPMLRFAGTAVVPENGLPEAKALATYHAASNDEDGIAKAIEQLVLA